MGYKIFNGIICAILFILMACMIVMKIDINNLNERLTCINENENFYNIESKVIGIAHAGGVSDTYPENTMIAMRAAAEMGFRYIEFDVNWTSDGIPVLIHDRTINRTARDENGNKYEQDIYIDNITYEESQNYDVGLYKDEMYRNIHIPTFYEAIEFCRDTGIVPVIEIKCATNDSQKVEELVEIVNQNGLMDIAWWLTDDGTGALLSYVKDNYPKATLLLNLWGTVDESYVEKIESLRTGENNVICMSPWSYQNEDSIQLLIDSHIPYISGEPVHEKADCEKLTKYAIGILSNDVLPERALFESALDKIH